MIDFKKITPVNGFDCLNPDNARQNNYAWAMEELGGYIYVGTGRNVFLQLYKRTPNSQNISSDLLPIQQDNGAEIWRYKKNGSKEWECVFKAPPNISGIRYLIRYTNPFGQTALYAGTVNSELEIVLLKSTDGINWSFLNTGIPGLSTRAMTVYKGKLYMGIEVAPTVETTPLLFASVDPETSGWFPVSGIGSHNCMARGTVTALLSFNNHLYMATALPGGFELWRTKGRQPSVNKWKLVIDKGAGDAANEVPLTLGKFKNHLYVGAILFPPITAISPFLTKPFDLIRVNKEDNWDLVVGSKPLVPTEPCTGSRHSPLSGESSGFKNSTNLYCWSLKEYKGKFYLGTFDWSVLIPPTVLGVSPALYFHKHSKLSEETKDIIDMTLGGQGIKSKDLKLDKKHMGFDLYESSDGVHWDKITLNGLGNIFNYGARNLFVSRNGKMYLGTSNPFQGCEVWITE